MYLQQLINLILVLDIYINYPIFPYVSDIFKKDQLIAIKNIFKSNVNQKLNHIKFSMKI